MSITVRFCPSKKKKKKKFIIIIIIITIIIHIIIIRRTHMISPAQQMYNNRCFHLALYTLTFIFLFSKLFASYISCRLLHANWNLNFVENKQIPSKSAI